MSQHFIGLMSGTSIDSIDAVLVDFSTAAPAIIQTHSHSIPDELRQEILSLCQPGDNEIERMGQLDKQLGELFANAVKILLSQPECKNINVNAIGSHGQTIRHLPKGPHPFSLQIANPAMIAAQTGITTIGDFRTADIIAGGQGAPMVPAFHANIFCADDSNRVILNLGGIGNITILPAGSLSDPTQTNITGFDTGPGNLLMDSWTQQHFDKAYDDNGQLAKQGVVNNKLLAILLNDAYFGEKPPKSTGREYFNLDWLNRYLSNFTDTISPLDTLSTLNALTITTVANDILNYAPATTEVLVCGGGTKNSTVLEGLANALTSCQISTTEKYGIHPDWVEAVAFAWLAKRTLAGESGNIPSVTGARQHVILGGIYKAPGA